MNISLSRLIWKNPLLYRSRHCFISITLLFTLLVTAQPLHAKQVTESELSQFDHYCAMHNSRAVSTEWFEGKNIGFGYLVCLIDDQQLTQGWYIAPEGAILTQYF